jgi:phospholipase/carboxylesterase
MLVHEIVPASRPAAAPFHCLVLHGLGDSMEGWKPAVELLDLPEVGWVFANAPEEYGPYGGYSWFDLLPDMTPDLAGVRASRAAVEAVVAHLLGELDIPSERLFVLGFSQGCLMALETALRGDHVFAGVVGISGWIAAIEDYPAGLGPAARGQRVLMTHGRFDSMLPIDLVRPQAQRLRDLGIDLAWKEYAKEHTLDQAREVGDIRAWMRERMSR